MRPLDERHRGATPAPPALPEGTEALALVSLGDRPGHLAASAEAWRHRGPQGGGMARTRARHALRGTVRLVHVPFVDTAA